MKLSNIRIAGKLSGLIVIAFVGMICLAVVRQYLMSEVFDAASYANKNSLPSLRTLTHANDAIIMAVVQLQRHVLNTDPAAIGEIERDIRGKLSEAENALRDYDDLVSNADDKRLLEADKVAVADLVDLVNQVLPLSRANKNEEARDLLAHERHHLDAVGKALDEHIQLNMKLADAYTAEAAGKEAWATQITMLLTMVVFVLLGIAHWLIARKGLVFPINELVEDLMRLAGGRLDLQVRGIQRRDEIGEIARAADVFKEFARKLNAQGWVKSRVAELSSAMQSVDNPEDLSQLVIGKLAHLLQGGAAVFYVLNAENGCYELMGSWGYRERKQLLISYRPGEGLVGQSVREKAAILLTDVPDDYIRISSGLGEATPKVILVAPIISKGSVLGVIEIASFTPFNEAQQGLIDELLPVVALNLEIIERNLKTQALLQETQHQAQRLLASEEELLMQSEELTAANEELRTSEEELRAQSDAQKAINEELHAKSQALEAAQVESDRRAAALEAASRYKSDFLANMSHELRTPLNSLLILSRSLSENEEQNLTADQVEALQIIHDGGQHLLRLINDILDLSKVEAGKMIVAEDDIDLPQFAASIQRNFAVLGQNRPVVFSVEIGPDVPPRMRTDGVKLDQIITNLVGNAFKFTHQGHVTVKLSTTAGATGERLAIAVEDSGIGIPVEKQEGIFAAFEQVDGTSSRQYGGTGLGLTISRRLAELLGGDLTVRSVEGQGSTFTLTLPLQVGAAMAGNTAAHSGIASGAETFDDDRATINQGDRAVLIVEDDDVFARIECDLARKRGFKCLRASDGRTALLLAERYRPVGVLLDIGLPDLDGWAVMTMLQQNPATRDIPVCIVSARDGEERGAAMGAAAYLKKPVDKRQLGDVFKHLEKASGAEVRRILIVDDDVASRKAIVGMVQDDGVELFEARDGHAALEMLKSRTFDCMILDLELPDGSGFGLLDRAKAQGVALPAVVVHTNKDLSYEESLALHEYTDSIVVKGERSPERLVEEVSQFLRRVEPQAGTIASVHDENAQTLAGRTVLVVDDDMRNAFALSKVLRGKGLSVLLAQDGLKALAQLEANHDIELVLMDIMMPGMDGYDTIRAIRNEARYAALPIIALTAKAMPGDREKCIEVGANDYYSKPVDTDRLMVAMSALLRD